jgi:hypothetical protein
MFMVIAIELGKIGTPETLEATKEYESRHVYQTVIKH